jgi:2',3'-cyclic-nucleotide 2'-phosphodiesterase (5'-nucleotidase family)
MNHMGLDLEAVGNHDFDRGLRWGTYRLYRRDACTDAERHQGGCGDGPLVRDEAATANALVPELQKQGASAIVLAVH